MKQNFEKRFKSVFGLNTTTNSKSAKKPKKPINTDFLDIITLIAEDRFRLETSKGDQACIMRLASQIRHIFDSDS